MNRYPHLIDALVYASELHADQVRKGPGKIAYMGHLLGVASIVIDEGGTEEQVVAALLHDAAEDQGGHARLQHIEARFGHVVADLVFACSDTLEEEKGPWKERKEAHIRHLGSADPQVLLVILADKVHNARSILLDLDKVGSAIWERFTASREETLWYFKEMTRVLHSRLRGTPHVWLVDELFSVVDRIECY